MFQGVRRRFQVLKESDRGIVVEDFAHHPTAAKATLGALRERYSNCDIIAVFEPRSASSRRNVFQKRYVSAFSKADQVLLLHLFGNLKFKKTKDFLPKI